MSPHVTRMCADVQHIDGGGGWFKIDSVWLYVCARARSVGRSAGDRSSGWETSCARSEKRRRYHQWIDVGATAALPSDSESDLRWEEHNHHLSDANRFQRSRRHTMHSSSAAADLWHDISVRRHRLEWRQTASSRCAYTRPLCPIPVSVCVRSLRFRYRLFSHTLFDEENFLIGQHNCGPMSRLISYEYTRTHALFSSLRPICHRRHCRRCIEWTLVVVASVTTMIW